MTADPVLLGAVTGSAHWDQVGGVIGATLRERLYVIDGIGWRCVAAGAEGAACEQSAPGSLVGGVIVGSAVSAGHRPIALRRYWSAVATRVPPT